MNRSKIRITYITKKGAHGTEFALDDVHADAAITRLTAQGCHTFRKFKDASALTGRTSSAAPNEPAPHRYEEDAPISDTSPAFAVEVAEAIVDAFTSDTPDTSSPDTGSDWSGGGDFGGSGSSGDY